jgi:hypothetical protein
VVSKRKAGPVAKPLIVQDPHQAGLGAGRQDVPLLQQVGKAIEHGQGPSGSSALVEGVRSYGRWHAVRIDPNALAGQGLDVGEASDPVRPARDGSTRARVASRYRSKRLCPSVSVPRKGAFTDRVSDDAELEVSVGVAALGVNRPARRRTVLLRALRTVEALRGLNLDATRSVETPARHFPPAVPPRLGGAGPAPRRSLSVFTRTPRAWYRDSEPLLQPAWAVSLKTASPSGRRGSLLSLQRRTTRGALGVLGPSSGAPRYARRPSPGPEHTASLHARTPDGQADPRPALLRLLRAQPRSAVSECGQSTDKKREP